MDGLKWFILICASALTTTFGVQELKPEGNGQPVEIRPVRSVEVDPAMEERLRGLKEEAAKPAQGLLRTSLSVAADGEGAKLEFSVSNVSGKPLTLTYGSGQKYDYEIYDERGKLVYRWSDGMSFTMALVDKELGGGESLKYVEHWDGKDGEGHPVPPGRYVAKLSIPASLAGGEPIDLKELSDEAVVELSPSP
ncbi:BsuPI-related putative proteinase inhibitor [Paenibacillaceae bacterium WGS1546]|uniref:BsuPI-related putative proteinase inhibitor n=1 Tax=Cohnella sp. WGS1546 TaxID=3366810 RepID=UPI00372D51D6